MASSRNELPPWLFHNFFSLGIGVATARFIHAHEVAMLVATQVIWVLSMVFISARAKSNGGKFLGSEVYFYHGVSIPFYVAGLLFAACAYAVFG